MNRILLLGNSTYTNYDELVTVENDISTMEKIFSVLGYKIFKCENFEYTELDKALKEFKRTIFDSDNIVIYYTGHGFHKNGHNFILAKDSLRVPNDQMECDFYNELKIIDVQNLMDFTEYNKNGNVLLIIDACRRVNEKGFENLREVYINTNTIWQLYSTSLGRYSYANGLFVEAIEKCIYRIGQDVQKLYESIRNYMECNCRDEDMQLPVLISGKNEFIITDECNKVIEEKYYRELIDIYVEVKRTMHEYEYPYSEDNITETANILAPFFGYPLESMKRNIRKMSKELNELGVLGLLFSENIKQIVVREKYFTIHGGCSNYCFTNDNLYNYDDCWQHIYSHAEEIAQFQYKYGKITCLNSEPCSTEKVFIIIINNAQTDLSYYIDDYFRNNTGEVKKRYKLLYSIFKNKNSILVSGRYSIKMLPFVQSLLNTYLQPHHRVCELVHLTQLEEGRFINERYELSKIFNEVSAYEEFMKRLKNKCYEWIIIPIMAYHENCFKENEKKRLMEIESAAKQNQISLIFYTDCLEGMVPIVHITKQALPFIEYIIVLKESENNKQVYIDTIRDVDNTK